MALSNWDIAAWNKDGIPTVGNITEKTIERFRKHKFFREECIEFPEFKELRRYNQGDAFIVKELYGNSPKTVCTRVGEQSNTILSQLLGA